MGRSIMLGLFMVCTYGGITMLILFGLCHDDRLTNTGEACMMSADAYIYIKGVWAGIQGLLAYPLVLISALNRKNLPPQDYQLFLQKQKQKLEDKKIEQIKTVY
jgi:hypothetical protein